MKLSSPPERRPSGRCEFRYDPDQEAKLYSDLKSAQSEYSLLAELNSKRFTAGGKRDRNNAETTAFEKYKRALAAFTDFVLGRTPS